MSGRAELLRFLLVGAVNFVFTFLIFTAALTFFQLNHMISLLLAWIAGNILTYVLNFIFVFRPEPKITFGIRFFKYLSSGAAAVLGNLALLFVLVDLAGYDPFWSQCAIMPFLIAFNFVAAKWWSLRKGSVVR